MDFGNTEELNAELLRRVADERDESDGAEADRLAFTRVMIDWMTADGGWNGGTAFEYSARGMHVSGYAWDAGGDPGILDVFVSAFAPQAPSQTMPATEIDRQLDRGAAFVREVLVGRRGVGRFENGPAADLSALLDSGRGEWEAIRIVLLANARILSNARAGGFSRAEERVGDIRLEFQVWDLDRMFRLFTGGRGHEPVTVDFREEFGALVPCLELPRSAEEYSCCLAVFPGDLLADIYERFGTQLLEKNVRVFLQERGKVNKGILKTIETRPQMFLAFNNGISITAKSVSFERNADGGMGIRRLEDFQIVNGGQTTASLHNARKKHRLDLSKTFVQAKISVIGSGADMEEIVRDISFYSNSQNKIKASDPLSGGAFHRALEQLSRDTWTPDGRTKWFYERTNGQYAVDKDAAGKDAGGSQRFEREFPKSQRMQKTDVAKYILAWQGAPETVSLGGEKCLQKFSLGLRDGFVPDEVYFKTLVAKAILFKGIDRIVKAQGNTEYKANVVAYTLALLNEKTENRINLLGIWASQAVPEALARKLDALSREVRRVIEGTAKENSGNSANVTEWAKKGGCWEAVKKIDVDGATLLAAAGNALKYPAKEDGGVAPFGGDETPEELAMRDRAETIKPAGWLAIAQWGRETRNLDVWKIKFCSSIGAQTSRGKRLSGPQIAKCCEILDAVESVGVNPESL